MIALLWQQHSQCDMKILNWLLSIMYSCTSHSYQETEECPNQQWRYNTKRVCHRNFPTIERKHEKINIWPRTSEKRKLFLKFAVLKKKSIHFYLLELIATELEEKQFRLVERKGTTNAILISVTEKAIKLQKYLYSCFIDDMKAFSTISYKNLIVIISSEQWQKKTYYEEHALGTNCGNQKWQRNFHFWFRNLSKSEVA